MSKRLGGIQAANTKPLYVVVGVSHPWSMGLNVLGYQSHLLQRCHPVCGIISTDNSTSVRAGSGTNSDYFMLDFPLFYFILLAFT